MRHQYLRTENFSGQRIHCAPIEENIRCQNDQSVCDELQRRNLLKNPQYPS